MAKNDSNQKKNDRDKPLHAILKNPNYSVHFIGIGGVSMYGLASMAKNMGATVTGSDLTPSDRTNALVLRGCTVFIGHRAENLGNVDLVVYSHAIKEDNPEIISAKDRGLLTVSRAEYLGAIMLKYKQKIGVSGSHGKSTTTAMLEHIFSYSGIDPTVLSGADLECGESFREGKSKTFIYEACEYCDSFLSFSPSVGIALNLEMDHTDYFEDITALRASFTKAMSRSTDFAVICLDDENLSKIIPNVKKKTRVVTYGSASGADYGYFINSFNDDSFDFTVSHYGIELSFSLNIPGVHNVSNAVAAITVALELGLSPEEVAKGIKSFSGIPGRLEFIGTRHGRAVYYDYAHHPTEISASINALKLLLKEPLTVVFKPHTYSRTKFFWDDFCFALALAERVIVTDIYPAREEVIEEINSKRLAEDIGSVAEYSPDSEVVSRLDEQRVKGAIILMGAGNFEKIKYDVLNK